MKKRMTVFEQEAHYARLLRTEACVYARSVTEPVKDATDSTGAIANRRLLRAAQRYADAALLRIDIQDALKEQQ